MWYRIGQGKNQNSGNDQWEQQKWWNKFVCQCKSALPDWQEKGQQTWILNEFLDNKFYTKTSVLSLQNFNSSDVKKIRSSNQKKIRWEYAMRSEKSYTKSENLFLRKSNLKLSRWKILILSFEQKCVKVVLNNIFVYVLDKFVKFRLVWQICFVGTLLCTFLANQSKTVVISSQISFRMLISIKNRSTTIIYSLIKVHKGVILFSNVAPKTLTLIFSKWAFSAFKLQNAITCCRIELLGQFF